MNGEGYIGLDVALFMTAVSAAGVNLYYLPAWWSGGFALGLIRLLRLVGWVVLSARFGHFLYTAGDIPISLPSLIGLLFIAGGDICRVFVKGKLIQV